MFKELQQARFFVLCALSLYMFSWLQCPQQIQANASLSFLYTNRIGKSARSFLTRPWLSNMSGYLADTRLSKYGIQRFIKKYQINTDELEYPVERYRSLNDFFARKLKPDARPICQELDSVTSPADGHILVIEKLTNEQAFPIKQATFNLESFVKDVVLAQSYLGGTMVIVRISPGDYHRFHFPITCTAESASPLAGGYESVNPIAYQAGIQPLTENERHMIRCLLNNKKTMLMVPVGALCVGRIKETYTPNVLQKKGDEAGYFEFGGSTVVLLFPPNTITLNKEIITNSLKGIETPIKMGQVIGQHIKS